MEASCYLFGRFRRCRRRRCRRHHHLRRFHRRRRLGLTRHALTGHFSLSLLISDSRWAAFRVKFLGMLTGRRNGPMKGGWSGQMVGWYPNVTAWVKMHRIEHRNEI